MAHVIVIGAGLGGLPTAYELRHLLSSKHRITLIGDRVPITIVTPEPYAGHLGIGGMANSAKLVTQLLNERGIYLIENAAITEIKPDIITLADGRSLPFQYSMLLPPFRGAKFLREVSGLTDEQGFVPILPTCQHPEFPSIYSLGVAVKLSPPEAVPYLNHFLINLTDLLIYYCYPRFVAGIYKFGMINIQ